MAACRSQEVDDLVRLHHEFVTSFPEGVRPCETWMVCGAEEAATEGNVAALRWLHESYPGLPELQRTVLLGTSWAERLARSAIKAHQLQVVRWLFDSGMLGTDHRRFVMRNACEAGSMELAVWLWESTADKRFIDEPWTALTRHDDVFEINDARHYLALACGSGNVALAQWVYATMDFAPLEARSEAAADRADQAQDALWRSLFSVDTPEAAEARFLGRLLPAAVKSGVVDMAEWVWATFRDRSPLVAAAWDAWEAGSAVMMEWVRNRMDTFAMERLQWQERVRHFGFHRKPDEAVMYLLRHALRIHDSLLDNLEARWCLRVAVEVDRVALVQAMFDWAPSLFSTPCPAALEDDEDGSGGWSSADEGGAQGTSNEAAAPAAAATPEPPQPPFVVDLFGKAHERGSTDVLLWLLGTFPEVPAPVPPKPYAVNLRYLQWVNNCIPGGLTADDLVEAMRRAAWMNMMDVVHWVWSLGVLQPADVSTHVVLSERYMEVSTLQAVWALCGDELYGPVFARQRDSMVRSQAALGDGVALTYAFSALAARPALVIESQCRPDSIRKQCDVENKLCLEWLRGHDAVEAEAPWDWHFHFDDVDVDVDGADNEDNQINNYTEDAQQDR